MVQIVALYGSPRRQGNTAALLTRAVEGARAAGATVDKVVLRDLKISPCLEIYGCKRDGKCVIKDDFTELEPRLRSAAGIMLASPIFFYAVSAHTKILMDRCNSLWVKKYWIDGAQLGQTDPTRKGLFISAGATHGKLLFRGARLSVKYFFDALDVTLWQSLEFRGLDDPSDLSKHPSYLDESYAAGRELAQTLSESQSSA